MLSIVNTKGRGERISSVGQRAEHSDMYVLQEGNHFSFNLSYLKMRKGKRRFIALQFAKLPCVCVISRLYISHCAHLGNVRGSEVQTQKIHLLEEPNNN